MSREGRLGVGLAVVSVGLFGIVPAADHFGFHLDDRTFAVIFVASVIALVVGLALMVHSMVPPVRWRQGQAKGAMMLASDTFQRRALKSGWGTATNGQEWWEVRPRSNIYNIWVRRKKGVIGYAGRDDEGDVSQWVVLDKNAIGDCDARVRFILSSSLTETAGILVREQSSSSSSFDHYLVRYDGLKHDGKGSIQLMVHANGKWDRENEQWVSFPVRVGHAYWLRVVLVGSKLLVWAWEHGFDLPTEPIIKANLTVHSKGGVGLYGFGIQKGGVKFDQFMVAVPVNEHVTAPKEP